MGESARAFAQSVAKLVDTAADVGRAGLQQVSTAVREERKQRIRQVIAAGALLILLLLGVLFAGVAVLAAFWDTHPVLAASLVAAACLLLAAVAGALLWASLQRPSSPGDVMGQLVSLIADYRRPQRH